MNTTLVRITFVPFMIILLASMVPFSSGRPVEITVDQNSVTMNLHLNLRENLTALPVINAIVDSSNSTYDQIRQPITLAFQKLVPSASVSGLQLTARTFNSTTTWFLQEDYTIVVSGTNTNLGSRVRSNLAFISMNMTQPILFGGHEINAVGAAYLVLPLNTLHVSAFYTDGEQSLSNTIPIVTSLRFWLLDFSWVSPVAAWTIHNNLLEQSTTWTLDPSLPEYNLTVGNPSPEGPWLKTYTAVYNPSFSLTVPANAWAIGSSIFWNQANATETIMPLIVLTALAVLSSGLVLDWRLTRSQRLRRKK